VRCFLAGRVSKHHAHSSQAKRARAKGRAAFFFALCLCCPAFTARGQIDPVKRELFQLGYNAALQGHAPLSAYAFYYHNQPGWLETNLTLRLAVAPTYLDSELGWKSALGPRTDLGFGVAGGGFADSYYEIRGGKYLPAESFDGFSGQGSISLYHLFNPDYLIPLYGIVRVTGRFVAFSPTSDTADAFEVPENLGQFTVRTGLRWGGREPLLFPSLAMELSIWEETEFRSQSGTYGFSDRVIEPRSHLFWAEASIAYTLPSWQHTFSAGLTAGTSISPDRFSAYRIGGFLPMVSEFPLSLPGYYYQEISAKDFLLLSGRYAIPLDRRQRWNITVAAATAVANYLDGFELPEKWQSGVGGGLFYTTPAWRVMIGYGYGIDALRSDGPGAHSIGFLLQLDLSPAKEAFFKPEPPGRWRGLQRVFGVLGS
jgi:hypothetical protein